MKTSEVLIKARDLIAQRGKWCKGEYARDKNGSGVATSDSDACQWCALGAIGKVTDESSDDTINSNPAAGILSSVLAENYPHTSGDVIDFNDTVRRCKKEVIAVFNDAIIIAERQERQASTTTIARKK